MLNTRADNAMELWGSRNFACCMLQRLWHEHREELMVFLHCQASGDHLEYNSIRRMLLDAHKSLVRDGLEEPVPPADVPGTHSHVPGSHSGVPRPGTMGTRVPQTIDQPTWTKNKSWLAVRQRRTSYRGRIWN